MCTDCSCNEWKWILLCDNIHSFFIFTSFYKLQICCDILVDRASFFTRSDEAVDQRNLFVDLSGRKWFYSLYMIWACLCFLNQFLCLGSVDTCEYNAFFLKKSCNLAKSVISAWFQDCCSHCYRPDSCIDDSFDVMEISTT